MANDFQDLSTFSLPPGFRGRSAFVVQLWWLVQATLFRCSPQFLYGWRRFLLRLFGASIGEHVLIRPTARVQFPWKLRVGDWSWIGDDVVLYSLGQIAIGPHAVVSQRSYICAGSHSYLSKGFDIVAKPVTIESEAWIATDCFVAPGVTIGRGAVVGARSTVLTDMPSGMVCVGSPAVAIKPRRSGAQDQDL
jgi:putative colanic acid biosynthesis acetyltransferase WcaF